MDRDGETGRLVDFDDFVATRYADVVRAFEWVRADGLDPRDVAQEAMLVISSRYGDELFATADQAVGYAVTVGVHLVQSWHRRGSRGYLHHEVATSAPEPSASHDVVVDAEALAVRNAHLGTVFATLPPRYRQVLQMTGDGLTHAEIAGVLGLSSTGAVKQLLRRARLAAKEALASVPVLWCSRRTHATAEALARGVEPLSATTVIVAAVTAFTVLAAVGGATPAGRAVAASTPDMARPAPAPHAWGGTRRGRGLARGPLDVRAGTSATALGSARAGDSGSWQPAGGFGCTERKQNDTAWFDTCSWWYELADDGNSERETWGLKQYGTGKSKGWNHLKSLDVASWRKKGSPDQDWVDWSPPSDLDVGPCSSKTVGVNVNAFSLSHTTNLCEKWDITKGEQPADFDNTWRGSVEDSERNTASIIATNTPDGYLPTDSVSFDYYAW